MDIFRFNPFYSLLSSETYSEDQLPCLPVRIPISIKAVIHDMLRVSPSQVFLFWCQEISICLFLSEIETACRRQCCFIIFVSIRKRCQKLLGGMRFKQHFIAALESEEMV